MRLVLVSPNMTYPLAESAAAQKVIAAAPVKQAPLQAAVDNAADATARAKAETALAKGAAEVHTAQATVEKLAGQHTSLVGLQRPLTQLKNPGALLDPDRFLVRDPRLAALAPRSQGRAHVEGALRAPEHRHSRRAGVE